MPDFDPTQPLAEIDLVFVDVETTGLYPIFGDRIVELGALKVRNEAVVDSLSQLIDPLRPISPGAAAVNGITDEMVRGKPTFPEMAASFLSFIDQSIIVAHNAPFDLGFLSLELRQAGAGSIRNPIVDTLQIARRYFTFKSNALGFLAAEHNIINPDAHRAIGDCRTTFELFLRFMDRIFPGGNPTYGEFMDRVTGWTVQGDETDPLNLLPPSLREPVKRREDVIIDYTDAYGSTSTRKIKLKEVAAFNDYIYVVAYCYAKKAERTFRLDRIVRWEKAPEEDGPLF